MSRAARAGGLPWPLGGVLAVVVAAAFVVGAPDGDEPLDPRSDARLGTSAVVALVEALGGHVDITDRVPAAAPGAAGPAVTVLLRDDLDDRQRELLRDWVAGGGTLVVVDPGSPLAPDVVGEFPEGGVPAVLGGPSRRCDIDAVADLDLAALDPRGGGVLYDVPPGSDGCVLDRIGDAYIVASDQGTGTVVAVGGSGMFVNAGLAEGENAPVVAALVAPSDGTDVAVLEPGRLPPVGTDGRSLIDLISPGVKRALLQFGIAFVVYALWRARRLGPPVEEPQPVALAGSELVAAVGSLLDRSHSPGRAAELLRAGLRRDLADRLGLPATTSPANLATVAATRTGIDEPRLRRALGAGAEAEAVTDDAGLAALAEAIDRIRGEALADVTDPVSHA